MKRSVDIGGTFTDCFVAWDEQYVEAKALTTHHNLALGFNEALEHRRAASSGSTSADRALAGRLRPLRDDARHQRADRAQGPRLGLLTTAGFESLRAAVARAAATATACRTSEQMDLPTRSAPSRSCRSR